MFILTVVAVLAVLLINEFWWRTHDVHSELGRKFVHVTVGSFVAFWPFFLSWRQIELLSVAFIISVGISRYFHIFRAIHSVVRPTWGEVFFALAVGSVALITHDKWIYMAAVLQMSIADGLAAIIGESFGRSTRYQVFTQDKSLVGTLTFLVISIMLLLIYSTYSGMTLNVAFILGLAVAATAIENTGIWGMDNLLVPLFIATALANF